MERRRLGEVEIACVPLICPECGLPRGHITVTPSLHVKGWRISCECGYTNNYLAHKDAADPARVARIKAEALREAADAAWHNEEVGDFENWMDWLRARAKRLEESE